MSEYSDDGTEQHTASISIEQPPLPPIPPAPTGSRLEYIEDDLEQKWRDEQQCGRRKVCLGILRVVAFLWGVLLKMLPIFRFLGPLTIQGAVSFYQLSWGSNALDALTAGLASAAAVWLFLWFLQYFIKECATENQVYNDIGCWQFFYVGVTLFFFILGMGLVGYLEVKCRDSSIPCKTGLPIFGNFTL